MRASTWGTPRATMRHRAILPKSCLTKRPRWRRKASCGGIRGASRPVRIRGLRSQAHGDAERPCFSYRACLRGQFENRCGFAGRIRPWKSRRRTKPAAILLMYLSGCRGGHATVDILTGRVDRKWDAFRNLTRALADRRSGEVSPTPTGRSCIARASMQAIGISMRRASNLRIRLVSAGHTHRFPIASRLCVRRGRHRGIVRGDEHGCARRRGNGAAVHQASRAYDIRDGIGWSRSRRRSLRPVKVCVFPCASTNARFACGIRPSIAGASTKGATTFYSAPPVAMCA